MKDLLENQKKHLRFADWDGKDIIELNRHLFITTKPMLYLVNLSVKDFIRKKNKWLLKIKEWVDTNDAGAMLIPFSGAYELEIVGLDDAAKEAYIAEHKCNRWANVGWWGTVCSRVGKILGFFKKTQPTGFFWVLLGFFGQYWVFLGNIIFSGYYLIFNT